MTDVLVADDHRLFVDLLTTFLDDHGYEVTATAAADGAVAGVAAHRPAICLVDHVALGGARALALVARLVDAGRPDTRVVVLTAHAGQPGPRDVVAAGAVGYVHKECSGATLVEVLAGVLDGRVMVIETPPTGGAEALDERPRPSYGFTAREHECLGLLVDGATTVDMARAMGVSAPTVRSHVQAVLSKLGVHSRLAAASLALRDGLVIAPSDSPRAG